MRNWFQSDQPIVGFSHDASCMRVLVSCLYLLLLLLLEKPKYSCRWLISRRVIFRKNLLLLCLHLLLSVLVALEQDKQEPRTRRVGRRSVANLAVASGQTDSIIIVLILCAPGEGLFFFIEKNNHHHHLMLGSSSVAAAADTQLASNWEVIETNNSILRSLPSVFIFFFSLLVAVFRCRFCRRQPKQTHIEINYANQLACFYISFRPRRLDLIWLAGWRN